MKINNILKLSFISMLSISSAYANEITTNSALMQSMDKVTGRVSKITVPVNSKISYGDFSLVLRACKKRPAEETPENFAFVDVTDKNIDKEEYNIFRGWMLSSTPGINAIEHPIYDIWLLECIDTDISNATLLTKEELDKRDALPTKASVVSIEQKNEVVEKEEKSQKTIHIKEFISEDRDIEKNIITTPSLEDKNNSKDKNIKTDKETSSPKNLLDFTQKQEKKEDKENKVEAEENFDIDNELYY